MHADVTADAAMSAREVTTRCERKVSIDFFVIFNPYCH
jgi:hypothetical protein